MKKGLAILTAICLCLSSVSVCASAVSAMAEGRQKTTIFVQFEGDPVLIGEAKGLSEKSAAAQTAKAQKHAMQNVENAAGSAEVLYTYTHALSGVAMEATKRDAAVLRDTEGVVNVVDLGGVRPIRAAGERGEPIPSGDMIGVDEMRELGYDGTGTAIAVIDCGLEYDHETMRLTDESTAKYTKADVDKVIRGTTLHAEGVTADDAYKSAKVPFAFNYCDNDTAVDQDADHGTHVSGIAAGNSATLEGVAPEAQVLIFRIDVYDDELFLATLLAAIDDAAKFDIASMNMSVGMDYEIPNDPAHELLCSAIDNARSAGILVCTAAGNAGMFADNVLYPDNGSGGIPNAMPGSTSVASVDNLHSLRAKYSVSKLLYDDDKYVEPVDASNDFPAEGALVPVDRNGKSADLTGKIALVYDTTTGTDKYYDKLCNKDMKAIIVPEDLSYLAINLYWEHLIPVVIVSNLDAYRLLHSKSQYVKAEYLYYYEQGAERLQNSFFSSYGVSEDLKLTVDVAAPGSPILSSVPGDSYDMMSGTSMACPHVTGGAALLRQYLDKTEPDLPVAERADLMENLLMSTANPVNTFSPRVMGAGVIDLADAVKAKAILTDKDGHSALNIGDGIDDSFKLSFTISNVSDETVRYDQLSLDVVTDEYETFKEFDYFTGETTESYFVTGESVPLSYSITQSDMPRSIVLAPGESRVVTMTVTLDKAELEENAKVFENGFYVEGYLHLSTLAENEVELTVPFMGFRGDWLQTPAILYYGDEDYSDDLFMVLRSLRTLTIDLVDAEGNVAASTTQEWVRKGTYYYPEYISELVGEIPEGRYIVRFTAVLDVEGSAQAPQVFEGKQPILIDYTAPRILKAQSEKQADGKYTIEITVDSDDVAYFELNGRSMFNAKYLDYFPSDGYARRNDDGSFVYVIEDVSYSDSRLVIYAVDEAGNSGRYHQYALLTLMVRWIRDGFARLREKISETLGGWLLFLLLGNLY